MTVCTGNICRSPIAQVVLADRFERAGLGGAVVVDSGGTSNEEEGAGIDRRARAVLAEAGYSVPHHRARQVRRQDIAARDLLLAMTARHSAWLRRHAPDDASASRVLMYQSFGPALPSGADLDIDDPWYGGMEDFQVTLAQVEAAADAVVEHVRGQLT